MIFVVVVRSTKNTAVASPSSPSDRNLGSPASRSRFAGGFLLPSLEEGALARWIQERVTAKSRLVLLRNPFQRIISHIGNPSDRSAYVLLHKLLLGKKSACMFWFSSCVISAVCRPQTARAENSLHVWIIWSVSELCRANLVELYSDMPLAVHPPAKVWKE